MAIYYFDRTDPVNAPKLNTELIAGVPAKVTGSATEPGKVKVTTNADLTGGEQNTLSGLIAAHDPALTPAQQTDADLVNAGISARDARDYIRRNLYAGTAVATVYSAVKAFVDGDPKLTQDMTNAIVLFNLTFGWSIGISMASPSAAQRGQYLTTALLVLTLLPG